MNRVYRIDVLVEDRTYEGLMAVLEAGRELTNSFDREHLDHYEVVVREIDTAGEGRAIAIHQRK